MTTYNWITLGITILTVGGANLVAFIYWIVREGKRRQEVEWRLRQLEERAVKRDEDTNEIHKINNKLNTLITILREKDVVNGHPDLMD